MAETIELKRKLSVGHTYINKTTNVLIHISLVAVCHSRKVFSFKRLLCGTFEIFRIDPLLPNRLYPQPYSYKLFALISQQVNLLHSIMKSNQPVYIGTIKGKVDGP